MDFYIEKNTYNDLVNDKSPNLSNDNIIFNNGDDWKLYYSNIITDNGFTYQNKSYILVSMYYVYDVNTNLPLVLIISPNESKIVPNEYLSKLLSILNQKCDYMPYAYFARSEYGQYLINIQNRLFTYQLTITNNKAKVTSKKADYKDIFALFHNHQKNMDSEILKLSAKLKLTQKNGTLFYLDSPYYVHQYLTLHDNDFFKKYTDNIKCEDFYIYTTKNFFRKQNDVCFPVRFKTEQEAQYFINAFYARKLIKDME